MIGGLAFAGLLVVGIAGWATMGRAPAAVPIIEADSRPLRVKPDNPGGMQVAGADEMVMGDQAGGGERMAPASEAPAPQALRAQMQQAVAPSEPGGPGPAAGQTVVGSGAGGSPLPDTPVRAAPSAARTAVAAAPVVVAAPALAPVPAVSGAAAAAAGSASGRGGVSVQLAAVDTQAAATAEWQRLAKRMPEVLGDRRPMIQKAERDGHAIWRVRTGGFADTAEATGFCTRLRAKGGACTLASF